MLKRFIQYMNPSVREKTQEDVDRRSLHSIHVISLICLVFETVSLIIFLTTHIGHFDHNAFVSLISVCYCITLCACGTFLSLRMLRRKDLTHTRFFLFKIIFYTAFTVWAIFEDYRHYRMGDQMLTFYAVNLLMICFVIFRPWIGSLLIAASFAGLYIPLYLYDGAANIEILNFIMLAVASIATNAIRCHVQLRVSADKLRLIETNNALENASRRDGLTGLQNRLALDVDAEKSNGRKTTVYMIDINYFKEINDRHGHVAGDMILREVSDTLPRMFPGGHPYRYGGDEFLVLTHKPPEENYGSDTYDFTQEKYGVKVTLSIGNAQGEPRNAQELFELISLADKALYVTKARTHSAEFGGHDRRKP